ncbi:MAG: tRNA pseudouridine(38-40) synthase TruA, partial [Sporomusaceae bacterium]|nr:tRNA pseudouridine(38-40) synthase TruA [Sporomusaceae bacterium]
RHHPLNAAKINAAAQVLVGEHDFSAFQGANKANVNPIKTIFAVNCVREADFVIFEFYGSGFLYHMVRNLVGTLVEIDKKKPSPEEAAAELEKILAGKDRQAAGITAPAQGLYLVEVKYS